MVIDQKHFSENLNWTLDIALDCLKRIIPEDVLPTLPAEEKIKYIDLVTFKNDKLRVLILEHWMYSNRNLEMFGTIDEVLFDMSYFARLLDPVYQNLPNLKNNQPPVVRYFQNDSTRFMLSKEVDNALRIALKRRHPNRIYPDYFLHMETAEERQRGIVYSIHKDGYEMMRSILGLLEDDITIVPHKLATNFQHVAFPIISSYQTQCYMAVDGLHDILNYLINVLAIFRGVNEKNLPKVWKWIESLEKVFVTGKTLYLIETKKIDELIDRARKELKGLITEPIYEIPDKSSYSKKEVFTEVKNLMGHFTMDAKLFETFYEHMTTDSGGKPLTVKYVYELYYQFMRYKVQNVNKKLENFLINQLSFVDTGHIEPFSKFQKNYVPFGIEKIQKNPPKEEAQKEKEKKPESGMRKGILKKKTVKVDEKNNNEKNSELEKKDKEIKELKSLLADTVEISKADEFRYEAELYELRYFLEMKEKSWKKTAENAENREKEMKSLLADTIEISRADEFRYEAELYDLRYHLEMKEKCWKQIKEDFENRENEMKRQLAAIMEKSKNDESKLKVELKKSRQTIETQKKVIANNKKDAENRENELKKHFQEELKHREEELEIMRRERKDNAKRLAKCFEKSQTFLETSQTIPATFKERIEYMGLRLSQNEKIKSELLEKLRKKEDFEEWLANGYKKFGKSEDQMCSKVRERLEKYQRFLSVDYDDLIDLLSSNLHRLTRLHPTSIEMLSAKSEVLEFDRNHDDFVKKVRAEIRKIQNNPAILLEELDEELDEFPDEKFMKNYNKWVRENNLE